MEKLFIDFVAPLTCTKRGNLAIIVNMDTFSKFVIFSPVRKISSQVVSDSLKGVFFPAYGTPFSIVNDNARVFCCKHFRDLCLRWRITHNTTTPYYPQASLAKQVNRNLKSALRIFFHESQTAWNEDLPWLSLAHDTALAESTKCTSDKLFLGKELKCPLLVWWDLSPASTDGTGEANQSFWTQDYRSLKQARNKVSRRYDANRKPHQYRVGDTVVYHMKLASSKALNISAKLLLRCSKPMVIAKIVRPK